MNRRLHVLGLPHEQTTRAYLTCAYTQKVVKFCKMMTRRGYEVVLYSGEFNEAVCTEHVPLVSEEERMGWYGPGELGYFPNFEWNATSPGWRTFNARAIEQVGDRAVPGDFLCLVTSTQSVVADQNPALMPVEFGVGYEGIRTNGHRVFESYAWMHHVYGLSKLRNGHWFDDVIPNFFDPADFPARWKKKGDYLLFMGRMVMRKGPHVAAQIAEQLGMPLVLAGPGVVAVEPGRVVCPEITIEGDHVEYIGSVGYEERAELLARARAVIAPTLYIEPFGGVAVEAMFAGTPAVTTDWGAFTETVEPGVTGERFRTLSEGVEAVERALRLDTRTVRARAIERFGIDAVGRRFDAYFKRLSTLWGEGWYELNGRP